MPTNDQIPDGVSPSMWDQLEERDRQRVLRESDEAWASLDKATVARLAGLGALLKAMRATGQPLALTPEEVGLAELATSIAVSEANLRSMGARC